MLPETVLASLIPEFIKLEKLNMIARCSARLSYTVQSIVLKASSLYTPKLGMRLKGFPTLTPRVWLRITLAPIVFRVFIISVILPKVG